MANIKSEMNGDKLVITVDTGKVAREAAYPSSTGKTNILASSGGFTVQHGDVKANLTVTLPVARK